MRFIKVRAILLVLIITTLGVTMLPGVEKEKAATSSLPR